MTPDQKYEIATLTTELGQKREIYEYHAATNIYGLEPAERERREIAYQIAKGEYLEAQAKLDRAMMRIAAHD